MSDTCRTSLGIIARNPGSPSLRPSASHAAAAAREALDHAGWHPESPEDRRRTATVIGTGVGGVPAITAAAETIRTAGVRRLSPFVVPSFLPNLAAGQVSDGLAYIFTTYAARPDMRDGLRTLELNERIARSQRKGIWRGYEVPTPPAAR